MIEENKNPVGRPQAYTDNAQLKEKINEYIRYWEGLNRPLTVVGMACYLDITKSTLHLYSTGFYDTPNQQFSDTIKKAKMYIEMTRWEGLLIGKYDKAGAIFDLKVNFKAVEHEKAQAMQDVTNGGKKEEEKEKDIFSLDLSNLSDEELTELENYRRIIRKAATGK